MNELVPIAAVRGLLGAPEGAGGQPNRLVLRRLRAIAAERGAAGFQLLRLGRGWFTTREDLRRLLPELFMHEESDADTLRGQVERQAGELGELRRRLEQLERRKAP